MRWNPIPLPKSEEQVDFIQGWKTLGGAGEPTLKAGMAIHLYAMNESMVDKGFYNSDGDLLIVPQVGTLKILTEFGRLIVTPQEICVIPVSRLVIMLNHLTNIEHREAFVSPYLLTNHHGDIF